MLLQGRCCEADCGRVRQLDASVGSKTACLGGKLAASGSFGNAWSLWWTIKYVDEVPKGKSCIKVWCMVENSGRKGVCCRIWTEAFRSSEGFGGKREVGVYCQVFTVDCLASAAATWMGLHCCGGHSACCWAVVVVFKQRESPRSILAVFAPFARSNLKPRLCPIGRNDERRMPPKHPRNGGTFFRWSTQAHQPSVSILTVFRVYLGITVEYSKVPSNLGKYTPWSQ